MAKTPLYNTLTGKWHTFASRRAADVARRDSDYWVERDEAPPEAWPDPPPEPPPTVPKRASTGAKKTTKKAAPKAAPTSDEPESTEE